MNSSTTMNKLKRLLTLATIAMAVEHHEKQQKEREKQKRRRTRRWWTREWILRRQRQLRGSLHLAHSELLYEDVESFHSFFRIDPRLFNILLDKVSPFIQKQDTIMRQCIPPSQRLFITLRYLATGESYRSLEFTTRIPTCTLSRIIPETVRVIYEVLRDEYLKIPDTEDEWNRVAEDYMTQWDVPNCIGALDGKHIQFKVPLSQGSLYRNYKGTDSIVFLALVDANYLFLYVNVGVNGRVSDGGVFRDSNLSRLLESPANPLNIPSNKPLPGMTEPMPYVILADVAFPLRNNILKPYPFRNMTHSERIFNYRLSMGRRVVENAFGILANRFRVLQTVIYLPVETVQSVTLACCALHNFIGKAAFNGITNVKDINFDSSIYNNQLQSLHVTNVRPNRNSLHVRSTFKQYFNTVGSVSWQENMVQ
ncbi:uncharacterized protein LOC112455499 [Temnothorax curvispinosus]|uniref:Uncharacterized protein LOC112455499 n=1 Tax=Temnothorax curvispinosus TaxID=300111 RepID=A0A6J1PV64_9HYME|nr:uncharacterized protein LOC112455499 [Temnothorax curvispinosus]